MAAIKILGRTKRINKNIPPVPKSKRDVIAKLPLIIHGANGSFVNKIIQPAIVVPVIENHITPVEEEPKIEVPVEKPVQNWKAKRENKAVTTPSIKE